MEVSPLAGKPADPSILIDVPRLVTAYYTGRPDPAVPAQRGRVSAVVRLQRRQRDVQRRQHRRTRDGRSEDLNLRRLGRFVVVGRANGGGHEQNGDHQAGEQAVHHWFSDVVTMWTVNARGQAKLMPSEVRICMY